MSAKWDRGRGAAAVPRTSQPRASPGTSERRVVVGAWKVGSPVESTERHGLTALIEMTSGQDGKVQAQNRCDPHAEAGEPLTPRALYVGESPRPPIRGARSRGAAAQRSRGAVTGRPINQTFRIGPGVRAAAPCSIVEACLCQNSLQIGLIERIWKSPGQPRINLLALLGTDMEIVPAPGWPGVSASVSCGVKHCHGDL